MAAEYQETNQLMLTQIKVSQYNLEKALYLVVDGASKIGMGFCILQKGKETDPTKGFLVINALTHFLKKGQKKAHLITNI